MLELETELRWKKLWPRPEPPKLAVLPVVTEGMTAEERKATEEEIARKRAINEFASYRYRQSLEIWEVAKAVEIGLQPYDSPGLAKIRTELAKIDDPKLDDTDRLHRSIKLACSVKGFKGVTPEVLRAFIPAKTSDEWVAATKAKLAAEGRTEHIFSVEDLLEIATNSDDFRNAVQYVLRLLVADVDLERMREGNG